MASFQLPNFGTPNFQSIKQVDWRGVFQTAQNAQRIKLEREKFELAKQQRQADQAAALKSQQEFQKVMSGITNAKDPEARQAAVNELRIRFPKGFEQFSEQESRLTETAQTQIETGQKLRDLNQEQDLLASQTIQKALTATVEQDIDGNAVINQNRLRFELGNLQNMAERGLIDQSSPQRLEEAIGQFEQTGDMGVLQQQFDTAEQQAGVLGEEPEPQKFETEFRTAAQELALEEGKPELADADEANRLGRGTDIMERVKTNRARKLAQRLASAKASGTNVTIGADRTQLPKTVQKSAILAAQGATDILARLSDTKAIFDEEFLTVPGKAKVATVGFFEQFGMGHLLPAAYREFSENHGEWYAGLQGAFNLYRKFITGAQAAEKEIKMLEDTFVNANMPISKFMGAMKSVEKAFGRIVRMNTRLLRLGADSGLDNPPFNSTEEEVELWKLGRTRAQVKKFEELRAKANDVWIEEKKRGEFRDDEMLKDRDYLIRSLDAKGLNGVQITEALRRHGYLTRGEAARVISGGVLRSGR